VVALLVAGLALTSVPIAAEDAQTLGEALTEGDVSVSLRYRYERVSEDRFDGDAHASSLRLTLGYATKPLEGVSVMAEFENVSDLGLGDRHNNGGAGEHGNGVIDRPVIADPEITSLQQVFLRVQSLPDTDVHAGRREVSLGNQRFVGAVAWRQHHQSLDAITVDNASLPRTRLHYSYVGRVHNVVGATLPTSSHLANAIVDLSKAGQLTLYGYWLSYDRDANAGLSTTTLGGRFTGSPKLGAVRLLYDLELAHQADAANNSNDVDAGYFKGELGLGWRVLTLKAALEVLEGAPSRGQFSTPLATLHKFNGWADKFLRTPENGLEDLHVTLGASWKDVQLAAIYHQFDANTGGADYGSEIDLQALYSAPWKQKFGVKLAAYRARSFASDTTKLWAWTSYGF
jgi:hypothetical protein